MKEKYRVYKNVLVICLAFLCQFTAFNGIGNLQSSINCEDGLGTATLASIYAGLGKFLREFTTILSRFYLSFTVKLLPHLLLMEHQFKIHKSGFMYVPSNIDHSKNWT